MVKSILILAVVSYAVLAAYAWMTADRQIFFPPRPSYTLSSIGGTLVPARDGAEIAMVHLPNPDAELTILFSHGNAEDLGHALPYLEALRETGYSVIGYDYRGYGASRGGGRATAEGTYRDIEAVYRYAIDKLGIPAANIVLFGRSVGSGPATHLAAREKVGGLIVENAFTSAFVVVTRVPLLPFDRFPNLENIRRATCPVLIIHAMNDEIIPLAHGRRLYEAAPGPKRRLWVEGAHHNDVVIAGGETYWRAIREFRSLVQQPEPRGLEPR
ncbi:MAG TPA: alpha/beta hydrolase [Thermoanaerobaculia bacterium]|nr:alpha/beta hydrolase [Thermoanaerobaculia bacterium]